MSRWFGVGEVNTILFSGNASEYEIIESDNTVQVIDTVTDRAGSNTLEKIEKLQFMDQIVDL